MYVCKPVLMILCRAHAKILLFLITILLGLLISENYAYCKYNIIWLEFLLRNVPCPWWADIVCQQYDAVSLNSTCPIEES